MSRPRTNRFRRSQDGDHLRRHGAPGSAFGPPLPLGHPPQAPRRSHGVPPVLGRSGGSLAGSASAQDTDSHIMVSMSAHLTGPMIAFLGWIPPLVTYFAERDKSPFIRHHASGAANFQPTLLVPYTFAAVPLVGPGPLFENLAWIGSLLIALMWILSIVSGVLGTSRTNKVAWYRHPISLRLLK